MDIAGRSALPQNVTNNVRELTVIHINMAPLALQFASKGRCISFLNLLSLPDLARASSVSTVVGRRTAVTVSPSSTSLCTSGLSWSVFHICVAFSAAMPCFVFIWFLMYYAFVKKKKTPRVRCTVNHDVVDSSIETTISLCVAVLACFCLSTMARPISLNCSGPFARHEVKRESKCQVLSLSHVLFKLRSPL